MSFRCLAIIQQKKFCIWNKHLPKSAMLREQLFAAFKNKVKKIILCYYYLKF